MKKYFLTSFLFFLALLSIAQQKVCFYNIETKGIIEIQSGDIVKLSYSGYLGQPEVKLGMILSVQDSIIEISAPSYGSGMLKTSIEDPRFIITKDITGFRKFRRSRPYLMALSTMAISIGTIFTYYIIDKKTTLSFGEKFAISLGSGIATKLIVRGLFPERIKNKIGKTWAVSTQK